ncbi:MAG TPA: isoprenylcysteine carboxylmethyltransferase family protein [Bryobacteraceae bacterium]|nr:isoprenylcysteine carboxylmethyltransferase family protein [Bryobacteraceae bacterium]
MDRARYYAALLLLMTAPGGILYWFSIHPFISFWRKVGPAATLAIHFALIGLLACVMVWLRVVLLTVEFGTHAWLIAPAAALFVCSLALRIQISGHLTGRILMGVPEIAPDSSPAPLLMEGPFARVRNPRYLQIILAILACALFSDYLAAYVVLAASMIMLRTVIWMEEKELRIRFGKAYDEYCARVPRLFPKLWVEAPR